MSRGQDGDGCRGTRSWGRPGTRSAAGSARVWCGGRSKDLDYLGGRCGPAERALERLGEVLHYGLRMHRESLDQVTFAEEWAFVRSYLEIESLRLEERLQLRLEADPEALQGLVPPFVLQPLVENAILHAVAPRKEGGRVAITARRRGDHLQLEVCDDGPGMPASIASPGAGLGLRLLRERLALLYAGKASLSLQPAEGGGVRATIDLPLDRDAVSEPA